MANWVRVVDKASGDHKDYLLSAVSIVFYSDDCTCSDGPYHYESCQKFVKDKPNPFEELGMVLSK